MFDPEAYSADVSCCEDEALAAWVDGLVEDGGRLAIEAHLAACESCYNVVTDLVVDVPCRPD